MPPVARREPRADPIDHSKGLRAPGSGWRVRAKVTERSAIATVLAVSIAAQTYLSMPDHGHSFGRMLAWQMTTSGL
ncbi:hypothetical protein LuPra_00283 [Luteitalea pratensis]|uniref:Uncharacterized protein n=1 Tax=Luteitalea pratensis TaxID=1855912 RepID=A0A143PFA5_LUTPR|nr:hypothetical protein LuPra_00283 [Luteitalea pratensis]